MADAAPEITEETRTYLAKLKAEWETASSLEDVLPLRFPSGAVFATLGIQCGDCGEHIPEQNMRGEMKRPTPDMATVEATALCENCQGITILSFRVRGDMPLRVEWFQPGVGWVSQGTGTAKGILVKFFLGLRRFFSRSATFETAGLPAALAQDRGGDPLLSGFQDTGWIAAVDAELFSYGITGLKLLGTEGGVIRLKSDDRSEVRITSGEFQPSAEPDAAGEMGPLLWQIFDPAEEA